MIKKQKKAQEANFWNKIAEERVYAAFSENEYKEMFDKNINSGFAYGKVLDIGCASGVSSVILSRRNFYVKGVDVSGKLIEQANRIWKDEQNKPIFEVGDAENLNAEDNSLDICFLGGVAHHFPDFTQVFSEIHRVLKKDGILLMVEPNKLDMIERITWFFAGKLGLLSPNEYPLNPLEIKKHLEKKFYSFRMYPIRTDDVPCLAFLPFYGKYFKGPRGKLAKRLILSVINIFRRYKLSRGNFFVISCRKRQ